MDNLWYDDHADVELANKYNKGIRFYFAPLIFKENMHRLGL